MADAVIARIFLVNALKGVINNVPTATVHLFDVALSPDVDTVLADFTEASYDTYPAGGITSGTLTITPTGNEEKLTTVAATFPAPTASGPVTIFGFYVTVHEPFSGGTVMLLLSAEFATPIVLTNGGSSLPLLIDLFSLDANFP
jgi:hypothetical protein